MKINKQIKEIVDEASKKTFDMVLANSIKQENPKVTASVEELEEIVKTIRIIMQKLEL